MTRQVSLRLCNLRSSLVNLPPILSTQLSSQGIVSRFFMVAFNSSYSRVIFPETLVMYEISTQSVGIELRQISKPSSKESDRPLYVGWSGLTASLDNERSTRGSKQRQNDEALASEMGWKQNDRLSIKLYHHGMTHATTVHVEPLTSDDWEILESNPQYLEDNILKQIRVLVESQKLLIWVYGKTLIQVKVTSVLPPPSNSNTERTTALYIITNETEIIVCPKTRFDSTAQDSAQKNQILAFSLALGADALSTSSLHPVAASKNDIQNLDDNYPVAALNPVQFSQVERIIPTALCCLSLLLRPNQASSSKQNPTTIPTGPPEISIRHGVNKTLKTGKKLDTKPTLPIPNIATEIGPSKDMSLDMTPLDLKEADLPEDQQSTTNKPEDILLLGFEDHLGFCERYLHNSLAVAHLFTLGNYRRGNHNLAGLMIRGTSGSGKTSLVKTLIEKIYLDRNAMMYCRYIDCGKHVDDRLSLLPAEPEHIDSFRYRHLAEEFLSIANAATKDKLVILVATCSSSASIHKLLRSETHIFSETLELKGLSRASRREIITELIKLKAKKSGLDISRIKPDVLSSEKTEGYLPSDLKDLVDRAVHQAIMRALRTSRRDSSKPIPLELADFENAQSGFVPISLRDVKLQKSTVNWSDIGGLVETRRILRETLEWPTKYPSIFANCPLRLRSGLLLYGYPGCGKTLLASAIAKECGLNFINIKGPELLNKYIGASEQSVRELFERAQVAKPCVLFFDEFESIAPKASHADGWSRGLEGVYVLAATSRPDLIDPALLRPGRLDKSLLCSMPTVAERHDILKAVSRALPLDGDLCFEEVAELTEGFTGADLQALIYSAHLEVVHESINAKTKSVEGKCDDEHHPEKQHKLRWTEIQPQQPGSLKPAEGAVRSRAENEAIRKRIEEVLENTTFKKVDGGIWAKCDLKSRPLTKLARLSRIYQSFVSSRSDGGLPGGEASEEIGGRASLM
ncbi:hypothetical protein H4Q26_007425 [Puccinia striiformis f. sp. tritici PST-130]|nr:hypothetical protein H4Q26_007425 [Puccinia striiformis f. sp. tritici PST-130]